MTNQNLLWYDIDRVNKTNTHNTEQITRYTRTRTFSANPRENVRMQANTNAVTLIVNIVENVYVHLCIFVQFCIYLPHRSARARKTVTLSHIRW